MFKLLISFTCLCASFFAMSANADTLVSCSWTQTGYTYVGPNAVAVYTCMDGSVAAAVWRKSATGGSYCDISAASGYYTEPCYQPSPKVYKVVAASSSSVASSSVASSVSACPKAGQTITVPQGRYDLIAAFCGSSCGFAINGSTAGSTLTGRCI